MILLLSEEPLKPLFLMSSLQLTVKTDRQKNLHHNVLYLYSAIDLKDLKDVTLKEPVLYLPELCSRPLCPFPPPGKAAPDYNTSWASQDFSSSCLCLFPGQTVPSMTCWHLNLCMTKLWSAQNIFWLQPRSPTLPPLSFSFSPFSSSFLSNQCLKDFFKYH